jgi:hypothetical protein
MTRRRTTPRTIRFQVVMWNIGKLDVVTGSVPMTFRVSLFWNDIPEGEEEREKEELLQDNATSADDHYDDDDEDDHHDNNNNHEDDVSNSSMASSSHTFARRFSFSTNSMTWKMHGRSKAILQDFGGSSNHNPHYHHHPYCDPRGNTTTNNLLPPLTNSTTAVSRHSISGHGPPQISAVLEVPPLSILNVATFETIGGAEIDCLDLPQRLFRWTAMYRATVLQSDVNVEQFPHDLHNVQLKLAILSQRSPNRTWDSRIWKLALATEADSQYSTRIPHGLIVDQVKIPGFAFDRKRGLQFEFCPLFHGSNTTTERYNNSTSSGNNNASFRLKHSSSTSTSSINDYNNDNRNHPVVMTQQQSQSREQQQQQQHDTDYYLKVSVTILRESGYYDQNIVPLVAILNVVAVSVLTFQDVEFFYRALITLNIAFVEMSIRMTADSHLPSVGYQIRLQRILNEWFVILMLLVLEGMLVFVLRVYWQIEEGYTKTLDWITAILALGHNLTTVVAYYQSKKQARYQLDHGFYHQRDNKKKRQKKIV